MEDREEFFLKLGRARHKAVQYLRIQALHLEETGQPELITAALELLDLLVEKYPDKFWLNCAQQQRARCLAALGRDEEAILAFRSALQVERAREGMQTEAYLDFARHIVACKRSDLYDEAIAALDEFGTHEAFPISQYRSNAVRAIIAEERGDPMGSVYAHRALEAAARQRSGFRNHPTLGLVGEQPSELEARLRRLAGPLQ